MKATLASEHFRASGGFAGEGVRRLMGAPNLSLLATVIRESLQNSCDAAAGSGPVEVMVRLRRLDADAQAALQTFLADLPSGSPSRPGLEAALSRPQPVVLEISDRGTVGLGGPTRADEAPPEGVRMDFVNFIRNVGAARDTDQGGGTYGYGKTSLYLTSSCGLILVDTLAQTTSGEARRLIGCHLGEAYAQDSLRYTGRSWWGVGTDDPDLVEPLTGTEAAALSEAIGLPRRSDGETGATVMILDPRLSGEEGDEDQDLDAALLRIEEIILWYFWPKMLDVGDGPAMRFSLAGPAGERPVRSPDDVAPLDLFADAWRKLHRGAPDVRPIHCQKPIKLLGRLAVRRGFRSPRVRFGSGPGLIPHTCQHIAVMRPVELVVRYYAGAALGDERQEWAGVFICDADPVVERAFADAEPPAHDDWIPENLPKGHAKTYVRVAVRELSNIAAAAGGAARPLATGGADGPSLARASESLARFLPTGGAARSGGGGEAGGGGGGGSGGGGRRARVRIEPPVFSGLQMGEAGVEALFDVRASNTTDTPVRLIARPGLVIDGALTSETQAPRGEVRILGWEGVSPPDASPLLEPGVDMRLRARIGVPAGAVVGLAVTPGDAT